MTGLSMSMPASESEDCEEFFFFFFLAFDLLTGSPCLTRLALMPSEIRRLLNSSRVSPGSRAAMYVRESFFLFLLIFFAAASAAAAPAVVGAATAATAAAALSDCSAVELREGLDVTDQVGDSELTCESFLDVDVNTRVGNGVSVSNMCWS